jgi:hypothetical protein
MAGDCEVQSSIPTGGARSGAGDGTGRDGTPTQIGGEREVEEDASDRSVWGSKRAQDGPCDPMLDGEKASAEFEIA